MGERLRITTLRRSPDKARWGGVGGGGGARGATERRPGRAVSVGRRRRLRDIDSRARGFPSPPQKSPI